MNRTEARTYILKRLYTELPSERTYHSLLHTFDVYAMAIDIGEKEGIADHDMGLLKVAALYHDAGFIYGAKNHEERGCKIVEEALPGFGFSKEEVERIAALIMATKVPQSPKCQLEEILCDADLDYLGRADFERIGATLFAEFLADGVVDSEEAWDELQIKFLSNHRYFTATSRERREAAKQENLKRVIDRVASRK